MVRKCLREASLASPDLDARLLVEWATGTTRLDVISNPAQPVSADLVKQVQTVLDRRLRGEPVHRIIGAREFYGLAFRLSAETLEPRPDTEALVELVLPFLKERIARNQVADLIDLGTGTGAIAIVLLSQLENLRAIGADISVGALEMARHNAAAAGVSARFAALETNWLENVCGRYDLIVSNPPYIPSEAVESLDIDVRGYDPLRALDGGKDGLDVYRLLARESRVYLREGGALAVEIGVAQRMDVEKIFVHHGWKLCGLGHDLAGHERCMLFN
ncbi:MAG: peptide chain release factor N(5)-glutamine methyltransferase [Phyllobacterium sp.]